MGEPSTVAMTYEETNFAGGISERGALWPRSYLGDTHRPTERARVGHRRIVHLVRDCIQGSYDPLSDRRFVSSEILRFNRNVRRCLPGGFEGTVAAHPCRGFESGRSGSLGIAA